MPGICLVISFSVYRISVSCFRKDLREKVRPEPVSYPESIDEYDTVILAYPNYWGTMPMAVVTFLERYDFTGKTVIPFNTHEGSGQSGTQQVIANALPGSTVLQGLAVRGKTAQENPEQTQFLVNEWLEELGMLKANAE